MAHYLSLGIVNRHKAAMSLKPYLLFLGLICSALLIQAQISTREKPYSFDQKLPPISKALRLTPADTNGIAKADAVFDKEALPLRNGIVVAAPVSFFREAERVQSTNGSYWRLGLSMEGARAMALYYKHFSIPEGGKLFLYRPDSSFFAGAFTSENNISGGHYATTHIPGDALILEYYHPRGEEAKIEIEEISYIYRYPGLLESNTKGFGGSQWCEVNVNCPEGDQWQNEKRGIARILIKKGGGTFWCSGSLINNTAQDLTPYFLTADHCGQDATAADLDQWLFYFNYESSGCPDPAVEPVADQMVGCDLIASSGGTNGGVSGADFYLVKLKQPVPPVYIPYFNGWTRQNTPPSSGVGIHHPAGDIKKISTFTQAAYSTQWGSTPGTHWGMEWAATQTNHGVTEGGSSGSPLFDAQKRIAGILSGGDASCSAQTEDDLYGKISYAWNEGSTPDSRLREWLDPLGSGIETLNGSYGNTLYVVADFRADTTILPVNSLVNFSDRSFGEPTSWEWTFEGGEPATSEQQNPSSIHYKHTGTFTVRLKVANANSENENTKLAYIKVIPNIYPNPAYLEAPDNIFHIDFGNRNLDGLELRLYNILGQEVRFELGNTGNEGLYTIDIREHGAGLFLLEVRTEESTDGYKLMLIKG
jgi:hypothetical protein